MEACGKAEKDLVEAFVNTEIYEYEQRQVAIDYDPEPVSVKQKKLKSKPRCHRGHYRSKSQPKCTSNGNDSNSNEMDLSAMNRAQTERIQGTAENVQYDSIDNDYKQNGDGNPVYIHTLTVRVKSDKLESLMERVQSESANQMDENDLDDTKDPDILETLLSNFSEHYTSTLSQLKRKIRSTTELNEGAVRRESIPPIVIGHGYGCAGGIIIPSITTIFETLLSGIAVDESPVIHIIDWLGHGMSSRPEFLCETTEEAEDWFVESLEAWREAMDIEQMILCGHSLGGYCSCVYAMRYVVVVILSVISQKKQLIFLLHSSSQHNLSPHSYPQHVDHLIGISPAGVPDDGWGTNSNASWGAKTLYSLFSKLWESGATPHDVIRMAGPKGKGMVQKMVQRRLFRLDDEDPLKPLLAEYLYNVVAMPGSGEYALKLILQPGARACHPLAKRIGCLKQFQGAVTGYGKMIKIERNGIQRQSVEEQKGDEEDDSDSDSDSESEIDADAALNDNLKIDFIYGDADWMVPANAVKLKRESTIQCHVYLNENCGHQLILENSTGFGELLGNVIAKGQITSL